MCFLAKISTSSIILIIAKKLSIFSHFNASKQMFCIQSQNCLKNSVYFWYLGSRSPVRSPPAAVSASAASFYPPLHSMWGFSSHHHQSNGAATPKDPAAGFGYPPTPPIDLKSSVTDNQHVPQPPPPQPHQDYLGHDLSHAEAAIAISSSPTILPSLSSIEASAKHGSSDHLMSSLGFPSYSSTSAAAAAAAASRKFHEGNGMTTYLQPNELASSSPTTSSSSPTAYPYFTSPGVDLYSGSSPYSGQSSTGVFNSRTLQPTRPRTKSRANAGKI